MKVSAYFILYQWFTLRHCCRCPQEGFRLLAADGFPGSLLVLKGWDSLHPFGTPRALQNSTEGVKGGIFSGPEQTENKLTVTVQ